MKKIIQLSLLIAVTNLSKAQDFLGLSTGNFAGISGVQLQPASIADSRLKFDMNITSISLGYQSNFLGISKDYAVNNKFKMGGFNSYYDFREKVLTQVAIPSGQSGFLSVTNTLQMPLSFMLTTGKKSAIALNIRSRTAFAMDNIPTSMSDMMFAVQPNSTVFNKNIVADNLKINGVSWLDAGLTYARVLVSENKHFLKAGITGKYIGGLSSMYLNADKLNINAVRADSVVINSSDSYVQYGHSASDFNVKPTSYKPDASNFGFDAGIVYEFRGRIKNFKVGKFTETGELVSKLRRDKNKYTFRLGASLLDVGVMNFTSSDLAKDFKINQALNLTNTGVNNIATFDSYINSKVYGMSGSTNKYSVALPTAWNVQADLHILKGLYVNGMMQRSFTMLNKDANFRTYTPEYIAITPRWESRTLGLYVPFVQNFQKKDWSIGTTVRVGPFFVGSNNLATLLKSNTTAVTAADLHAGIKIPIGFGKPSKAFDRFNKLRTKIAPNTNTSILNNNTSEEKESTTIIEKTNNTKIIDNTTNTTNTTDLQNRLRDAERRATDAENKLKNIQSGTPNVINTNDGQTPPPPAMQPPVKIIINNYTTPNGKQMQNIDVENGNDDIDNQIKDLKRKIELKQKLLNELKTKDNSSGCIETKKKMVSLKDSYFQEQTQYAITPTGSSVFALNNSLLDSLTYLQNQNKAIQNNMDTLLKSIDDNLKTVKVGSQEELCLLWKKNELMDMRNDFSQAEAMQPLSSSMPPLQNNIANNNQIDSATLARYYYTARNVQTQNTNTIYYKIDSTQQISKTDYKNLQKEISGLRNDVSIYKDLATKNQNNSAPIIIKRPLFGRRNKNTASDEEAMQLAIAKLRRELKPTIIRDTIVMEKVVEKIVEKPVIKYVDKVVEKPILQYVDKVIDRPVEKVIEKTVTKVEQLLSLPPDVILFDVGKSLVKPQYNSRLTYYATQLKKFTDLQVTLNGFTDNSGNAALNQKLSEARANAVKKTLLNKGVAANQIVINFNGDKDPVAGNDNAVNKSQNRRVEINFNK